MLMKIDRLIITNKLFYYNNINNFYTLYKNVDKNVSANSQRADV